MRFLHFSTEDTRGGAAAATYRFFRLMRDAGHDSKMLVLRKYSVDDDDVRQVPISPARYRLDRATKWFSPARRYRSVYHNFDFDREPPIDRRALFAFNPDDVDIICLHWVSGFLTVRLIRALWEYYRRPMLWTLADQAPITGGCHATFGCTGYTRQCGNCPQLRPASPHDLSNSIWRRKASLLKDVPLTIVCGPTSSQEDVRASSAFSHHRSEVVPWVIDENYYRPLAKRVARQVLGIAPDADVVFFGATDLADTRKGMGRLIEAFHLLRGGMSGERDSVGPRRVVLLVAGHGAKRMAGQLPFESKTLGYLTDDVTLALAYQASDVFVCPSVEDMGPLMIPQAMMCGLPVVSFPCGYARDLVQSMVTGYLCENTAPSTLAEGIRNVLFSPARARMGRNAYRSAVARHATPAFLSRYLGLCEELRGSLNTTGAEPVSRMTVREKTES